MNLLIEENIDKGIYYKKLTNDKVINITGEGGSGKSTIAEEFKKDSNYVVVDYDMIFNNPKIGTIENDIKQMLIKKYGDSLFNSIKVAGIEGVKSNFTIIYNEIINYLSNNNKTIVLDGSQLRFINDAKIIKGEFIALRPSLQTCIKQSKERFIKNNPLATKEQIEEYEKKRTKILKQLNPLMNNLIINVDKLNDIRNPLIEFDNNSIQNQLSNKTKIYLSLIKDEYGSNLSPEQTQLLTKLMTSPCIQVDLNGNNYLSNQISEINNNPNLTNFQKIQEIRKLNIPLAHGGRVFGDNIIHFYPSTLLSRNPNLSTNELMQKCDSILIHELLHFFIRPQEMIIDNQNANNFNSYITEGFVDMCARDLQTKYQLFPNYSSDYGSNVIFVREALSNLPSKSDRNRLIFSGSIEQFFRESTTKNYNTFKKYNEHKERKTNFDKYITNISSTCYSNEKEISSCNRFLYNYAANFESKEKAAFEIHKSGITRFPEKKEIIASQFITYSGQNSNKKKIGFDQRSQNEIEIAKMIREKNQTIADQKKIEKAKVKKLVRTNDTSTNAHNSGFISILALTLIICFILISIFINIKIK